MPRQTMGPENIRVMGIEKPMDACECKKGCMMEDGLQVRRKEKGILYEEKGFQYLLYWLLIVTFVYGGAARGQAADVTGVNGGGRLILLFALRSVWVCFSGHNPAVRRACHAVLTLTGARFCRCRTTICIMW